MRTWTIRTKIEASFALVITAMAVMAAFAYYQLDRIDRQSSDMRNDSLPELSYSAQLLADLKEDFSVSQEIATRQKSSDHDVLLAEIRASHADIDDAIGKYGAIATKEEADRLEEAKKLLADYRSVQQRMLKAITDLEGLPQGVSSDAQRIALAEQALVLLRDQFHPSYDRIRDAVQDMVNSSRDAAERSAEAITGEVVSAKAGILISIAVGLALALVCGFLLLRAVTRPLNWLTGIMDRIGAGDFTQRIERSDEFRALGESFNRIAELFGNVQATSSEIAAASTEIGATSKQISATSRDLVSTMGEVATVAEGTAALAGDGQTGLSRMESTMNQVVQAASSINAKLSILNEKAGNINQVVTTITKVADQTNLLSLNAAIEAEKAGEFGRGFAVVASEVRRLADQTAVATYDIEQMVKEIQSAVSAGVMGMDKFSEEVRRGIDDVHEVGRQLSQIIEQVQALVPRFETANEGMQAQAVGAEQITEAILQLTESAQQTAESLRRSRHSLNQQAVASSSHRGGASGIRHGTA